MVNVLNQTEHDEHNENSTRLQFTVCFFGIFRKEWISNFSPRNLITLSAEPLLVEPTHYTGEPNYISDTENSFVVRPDEEVSHSGKSSKEEL